MGLLDFPKKSSKIPPILLLCCYTCYHGHPVLRGVTHSCYAKLALLAGASILQYIRTRTLGTITYPPQERGTFCRWCSFSLRDTFPLVVVGSGFGIPGRSFTLQTCEPNTRNLEAKGPAEATVFALMSMTTDSDPWAQRVETLQHDEDRWGWDLVNVECRSWFLQGFPGFLMFIDSLKWI